MATSLSFPRVFALAMLLSVFSGCGSGSKMVSVSGTATMDGKPLAGASVLFVPKDGGRPASGTTDEQGRFSLMTIKSGDGVISGTYLVSVTKLLLPASNSANTVPNPSVRQLPPKSLLPNKYANEKTSGLVVEVSAGMEPLMLELTSR